MEDAARSLTLQSITVRRPRAWADLLASSRHWYGSNWEVPERHERFVAGPGDVIDGELACAHAFYENRSLRWQDPVV
ncbi:MAG TPA: hypothetical protein VFR41_10350, partial [Acidimicrobiia bacterium]|nr:hypothetical protein [Acidimicrobiia bacterium]